MIEVGAFDAKTHFPALLDRIEKGEEIIITRRGKPVAEMRPVKKRKKEEIAKVVSRMLKRRDERGPVLGKKITIRQLRDLGRK